MVHCINLAQKVNDLDFVAKIETFFTKDALKCPPKQRLCMNIWKAIFASLSIAAYSVATDADADKHSKRATLLQGSIQRFEKACRQKIDVANDEAAQDLLQRLSNCCVRCCKHLTYVDRQALCSA